MRDFSFWKPSSQDILDDMREEEESRYQIVQKPGVFRRIYEAVMGDGGDIPADVLRNRGYYYLLGEQPEVTFKQLIEYHDKTPQLESACGNIAEMIYGVKLNVNSDDDDIKAVLEVWNKKVKLYQKSKSFVKTMLVCGTAIVEKLSQVTLNDILEVDMATIIGKRRDDTGRYIEYYVQELPGEYKPIHLGEGIRNSQGIPDVSERFTEFSLGEFSRRNWARSLFYSLAAPRKINGKTTKPLVEDMWEIEDSMSRIFHNFADPMRVVTYAGASKKFIKKMALMWKKLRPGDNLIVDRKPEINIIESSNQGKFGDYVQHMENTFEVGTKFSNQFFTAGFTARASSQTTSDIIAKKVRAIQNYVCERIVTEFYIPYLLSKGYSQDQIDKANIQASFEAENIVKLTPTDVQARGEANFWTRDEVRNWDKSNGSDLYDDDNLLPLAKSTTKTTPPEAPEDTNPMKPDNTKNLDPETESLASTKMKLYKRALEIVEQYKKP